MIRVDIDVKDGLTEPLANFLNTLEDEKLSGFNAAGGAGARDAAKEYLDEFQESGKWRGKNYLDGPGRKPGEFSQDFAGGWNIQDANSEGVTISNNAEFYAFKVTGGTITPKHVDNLTLPMVREAAGRGVREYETATGNRLFRVLGKKALFENTEDGGFRAVYALVKQVTLDPWEGALPDNDTLTKGFFRGWNEAFEIELEKA